jgi:hypothetical protein
MLFYQLLQSKTSEVMGEDDFFFFFFFEGGQFFQGHSQQGMDLLRHKLRAHDWFSCKFCATAVFAGTNQSF